MDQEPQTNGPKAEERLLKRIGIDPGKWTVGDRRIAQTGIGIALAIVIVAICGYAFEWSWTGLTEPKVRTFWDWLSLLIVPLVLALGGYLFNRSESRSTQEIAERQRAADRQIADQRAKTDREIADQRRQDDALQAYLDHIGELLLDKDRPLGQSKADDKVGTLARARTLTALRRLDGERKGRVLQFLYETGLIAKDHTVLDLRGADLSNGDLAVANLSNANLYEANLYGAKLSGADLSYAKLRRAILSYADLTGAALSRGDLRDADLSGADLSEADLLWADLSGATMPNGQKYEDWFKDQEGSGENDGP